MIFWILMSHLIDNGFHLTLLDLYSFLHCEEECEVLTRLQAFFMTSHAEVLIWPFLARRDLVTHCYSPLYIDNRTFLFKGHSRKYWNQNVGNKIENENRLHNWNTYDTQDVYFVYKYYGHKKVADLKTFLIQLHVPNLAVMLTISIDE